MTSNEGESYVYYYGSWVDSTLLRTYLGSNFTSGNVLVKAIGTQDIDVESVDLSGRGTGSHLSMQLGSVFPVDAAIEPANATDKTLTWRPSDPTVAPVDSEGNVKALRAGNATITARAASGAEGRLDITVVYIPVQKVTIGRDDAGGAGAGESAGSAGSGGVAGSGGADSLRLGDSVILHATVTPTNATYLDGIVWGSTNPKVVKVDQSGIVTAVGRGSTTVTAIAGHVGALYRVSVE
ncbi:Ig-like domain-containing protein [Bifidobacterium boum]|uniref:Ig-like domain-containing protein n=1 Tax=Bifidobacterium boum TaxID=78343 RepID=UPI003F937118